MSNKKKIILISLPVVLCITGMLLFIFVFNDKDKDKLKPQIVESFIENITEENHGNNILNEKYRGGIAPHHLLAESMIEKFFVELQKNNPDIDTFIVLGPNHLNQAKFPATTTKQNWATDFSEIKNNEEVIDKLIKQGVIQLDDKSFEPEHSIAVLTPFIKKYFPHAKIVPIIFTTECNLAMIEKLSTSLTQIINDKTFVLASLDFSHYLSQEQANVNDELTWKRIMNYKYDELSEHNSDYLDSPATLVTLMKTMCLLESQKIKLVAHKNSADFDFATIGFSTSYFTTFFY